MLVTTVIAEIWFIVIPYICTQSIYTIIHSDRVFKYTWLENLDDMRWGSVWGSVRLAKAMKKEEEELSEIIIIIKEWIVNYCNDRNASKKYST